MSLVERPGTRLVQSIRSRLGLSRVRAVASTSCVGGQGARPSDGADAYREGNDRIETSAVDNGRVVTFNHRALSEAGLSDWAVTHGLLKEQIRVIKRRLLSQEFFDPEDTKGYDNVIMVTSSRPEEGKTFTALSLGFVIAAEPSRHVLLVDIDGSQGGLRRFLNATEPAGLTDLLQDSSLDVATLVAKTDVARLSVLLAGSEQRHAGDLIASRRMRAVIDEIVSRYPDWLILIDAPPCLASSIPATIAAMVGQVVFVVQADRTQREEVEAAVELLAHCPRISLLLNKTSLRMTDSFGAYAYN